MNMKFGIVGLGLIAGSLARSIKFHSNHFICSLLFYLVVTVYILRSENS